METYFNVKETAKMLRVSTDSVRQLVRDREIESIYLKNKLFFTEKAIQDLIQKKTIKAKKEL